MIAGSPDFGDNRNLFWYISDYGGDMYHPVKKRKFWMSRHYIVCIIMLLFIGISGAGATEPVDDDLNTSEKFVASPLSPAFISYLENQEVRK